MQCFYRLCYSAHAIRRLFRGNARETMHPAYRRTAGMPKKKRIIFRNPGELKEYTDLMTSGDFKKITEEKSYPEHTIEAVKKMFPSIEKEK